MPPAQGAVPGIVTPEAVRLEFSEAGLGSRSLAFLVDVAVRGGLLYALIFVLGVAGFVIDETFVVVTLIAASFAVIFVYPVVFETIWNGRTPGKMALGLRVVTVEGAPVRFRHAAIRSAVGIVDFLIGAGSVAILTALATRQSQRLGDLAAGTIVVRERQAAAFSQPIVFQPPQGWGPYGAALDVSRLSDEAYILVRSFLLRVTELRLEARRQRADELAAAVARHHRRVAPAGHRQRVVPHHGGGGVPGPHRRSGARCATDRTDTGVRGRGAAAHVGGHVRPAVAWRRGLPRSRCHHACPARGARRHAPVARRAGRQPVRCPSHGSRRAPRPSTTPATSSPRPPASNQATSSSPLGAPRPTTSPSPASSTPPAGVPCARPPSTTPCSTASSPGTARSSRSTTAGGSTSTPWPRALDDDVTVVSVMAVNNETGMIADLAAVVALVRERAPRAAIHTDAVQALSWLDVPAATAGVDLLSLSAHKFGGPQGVGVLAVRSGVPLRPQLLGGGQERGRRSGTQNVAGIVGAAAAAQATVASRPATVARIGALRDRLADGLVASVADVVETGVVAGDRSGKIAGNCHLCVPDIEAETLLVLLEDRDVYASAASSCSSGAQDPSHVLAAMGVPRSLAQGSLRLSLGWSSTTADVDVALEAVPAAIDRVRQFA